MEEMEEVINEEEEVPRKEILGTFMAPSNSA